MAWRLALREVRVLVLEADEEGSERAELVGRFEAPVSTMPGSPYKQPDGRQSLAASPDGEDDYYVQAGTAKYKSTYERRVGGTSWHWLGNVPRLLPSDFRWPRCTA